MSSNYSNVVGGKLKLKGSVPLTPSHDLKKKKKKKSSSSSSSLKREEKKRHQEEQELEDHESNNTNNNEKEEKIYTESELRHRKLQARIEEKRIKEMIKMSHKEKVEDFNKKLNQLSEHHDVPKVGPG
ncbi:DUF1754 family protein [Cavenderia fasciculata]|uniref:DUF1754 family protein n=1 Tax=Cavenderia fasciculata TaxID=261658 RepID=F4PQE0_CACFS|nr:DUF1754 family protein [Cavenderia fasciculata]EGG22603.1 DUF1754 family protein [Cavenderia fasciculata]|eukprot:XP_004360454.1 DUF1754 family protein [Cavenderia fasciculata]